MSNSATFEIKTSVNPEEIQRIVSKIWTGTAYNVDILKHPDVSGKIFCILDYFFGNRSKEYRMLMGVLDYLFDISEDKSIYYYRCDDFFPIKKPYLPILEINAEDLFTSDFGPSIGASVEVKYLISPSSIKFSERDRNSP